MNHVLQIPNLNGFRYGRISGISVNVILVTILILLLTMPKSYAQKVLLGTDFSTGSLPDGWQVLRADESSNGWQVGPANALRSPNFRIPQTGFWAATNDDACGANCNKSQDRLLTPPLNLTTVQEVIVDFDYYLPGISEGRATEKAFLYRWVEGEPPVVLDTLTANINQLQHYSIRVKGGVQGWRLMFEYNDGGGHCAGLAVTNILIVAAETHGIRLEKIEVSGNNLAQQQVLLPGIYTPTAQIRNMGVEALPAFILAWQLNENVPVRDTVERLEVLSDATYTFESAKNFEIEDPGFFTLTVWVELLPPLTDPNKSDDSLQFTFTGALKIPSKTVVLEHFTSANNGNCPVGDLALAQLQAKERQHIFVTHHDADSMANPDSRDVIRAYSINRIPSATADRSQTEGEEGILVLRNTWEHALRLRSALQVPTEVRVVGQDYNTQSRRLQVTTEVEFYGPAIGPFRLNLWVVEDSVTGMGIGYDQRNFSNADPNSPFFQKGEWIQGYTHNNVVRLMAGGAFGLIGAVPDTVKFPNIYRNRFNFVLPANINTRKARLVGVLHRYTEGLEGRELVNAAQVPMDILTVTLTADTNAIVCGGAAELKTQTNRENVRYSWFPADDSSGLRDPTIPNPVVNPTKTTTYNVTVASGNQTAQAQITIYVRFSLDFSQDVRRLPAPPYTVNFVNLTPLPQDYTFMWHFGDGDSTDVLNPSHTYQTDGIFDVKLTAKHKSRGCVDTLIRVDWVYTGFYVGRQQPQPINLKVYPNPASTVLTLSWQTGLVPTSTSSISLIDAMGRIVWVQPQITENMAIIPVGHLNSGVYSVLFVLNEQVYTHKVVIRH